MVYGQVRTRQGRRAELLAAHLPATDAAAQAERDHQAAELTARLTQLDTAQKAQILSLEQLSPDPADTAATAIRAQNTNRFAELHHEREQAQAQLDALHAAAPTAVDPALLDELPLTGNILPGLDPARQARLFAAVDLQIVRDQPARQATVHAEITQATLRALPGLLNPGRNGYDHTAEPASDKAADVEDLFEAPMIHGTSTKAESSTHIRAEQGTASGRRLAVPLVSVLRGFEHFAELLGAAPRCDHAALRLSLRAPGAAKHSHPAPISQLLGLFDPAARSLAR